MIESLLNPFSSNRLIMKDVKNPLKLFSFGFLFLVGFMFLTSFVLAEEELNLTDKELAEICINQSEDIMLLLSSENFSVVRVNDTLKILNSLMEVQLGLEEKGRSTDYGNVLSTCDEILQIKNLAFELRDSVAVLEEFYQGSSKGIDTTEIDSLMSDISREMTNERYELVPALIEDTYSAIIVAQSRAATLNVFYDATTRGLKRFLTERWLEIIITIVVLTILFFLFKTPIEKKILQKGLERVQIRRKSLKDMITKNQDLYFNKGKMSEDSFTIKNKKLAELIRDVDRQMSIYNEQIYALEHKNKSKKKKK